MKQVNIFWFRRDLRLSDNAGLYHALRNNIPVVPVFIFDTEILSGLEDKDDQRVQFIHEAIKKLQHELVALKSTLHVFHGTPKQTFERLLTQYDVQIVYANHDYEPYAIDRDKQIAGLLQTAGKEFKTSKDQVIFEKSEVEKDDGKPYTVFTPYSKKWKSNVNSFFLQSYPTEKYFDNFLSQRPIEIPTLQSLGFEPNVRPVPSVDPSTEVIKHYTKSRDFPGIEGTSRIGVHLRFGTISIRNLATIASSLNETYLNELIWREFYQAILWHFPHVGKGLAFKPAYDHIQWRNNETEFERWCNGETGYPIVDAGMRQLNETGFMHNRVRMVVASFLCKHLLIDWRWGEAYFARRLLDFEFASNNGGWQWAAGSGCDAAPYFRIFNPYLQTKKFDPELTYVKKWVPEFQEFTYPKPIVEHEFARKRCLEVYSAALKSDRL
ncbi:MAG: deoxyribodipyrimidine photo-lyase [Chitinophagaceae bacterium]|nr:deoxyribodipyrimidine photo-lyase [Chitinophagaceae bacterium]